MNSNARADTCLTSTGTDPARHTILEAVKPSILISHSPSNSPSQPLKQVSTLHPPSSLPYRPLNHPGATDVTSNIPITTTNNSLTNPRRRSTTTMQQGLSHLSRKRCATSRPPPSISLMHALSSHMSLSTVVGRRCKGLSDYRQASGLWDARRGWSAVRLSGGRGELGS